MLNFGASKARVKRGARASEAPPGSAPGKGTLFCYLLFSKKLDTTPKECAENGITSNLSYVNI